jgi:transposase
MCVDEFGPLDLQSRPGRQWAPISGNAAEPGREPRRPMRATYTRTSGIRHLFAAYDLGRDQLYGHIKARKTRTRFLEFATYLRTLYPREIRIALVIDNFSPHLSTRRDQRVGAWAAANDVELAYTPTNSSWLNRIEAQFAALRYFALDGTDHRTHREQGSMIRHYIIWRTAMSRTCICAGSWAEQLPPEARHQFQGALRASSPSICAATRQRSSP